MLRGIVSLINELCASSALCFIAGVAFGMAWIAFLAFVS